MGKCWKEWICPRSSWHAFYIILITVSNKRRSTQIYYHTKPVEYKCTLAKLYIRNITYFIHTSLVYKIAYYWKRQMSLGLRNPNITCDWLSWQSWQTPTLQHYGSSHPVSTRVEIYLSSLTRMRKIMHNLLLLLLLLLLFKRLTWHLVQKLQGPVTHTKKTAYSVDKERNKRVSAISTRSQTSTSSNVVWKSTVTTMTWQMKWW